MQGEVYGFESVDGSNHPIQVAALIRRRRLTRKKKGAQQSDGNVGGRSLSPAAPPMPAIAWMGASSASSVVDAASFATRSASRTANLLASEQHSTASVAMSVIYQTSTTTKHEAGVPLVSGQRGWVAIIEGWCSSQRRGDVRTEPEPGRNRNRGVTPLSPAEFECSGPLRSTLLRRNRQARRPKGLRQTAVAEPFPPAKGIKKQRIHRTFSG